MAYNNRNKLKRVKEVQDMYREHSKDGVSTAHVYRTYIYPKFHISERTFSEYLSINVALETRQIDQKFGEQKSLF